MKVIRVGDPHVKHTNLEESQKIIDFAIEKALEHEAHCIEFLGDLFHTHAIVRQEVLDFWFNNFQKIKNLHIAVVALVGNHDVQNIKNPQTMNALNVFKEMPYVTIVDKPLKSTESNVLYMPYYYDVDLYIKDVHKYANNAGCLVTHMTIAKDNNVLGYYDDHAIDPDLLPNFRQIISGHIHTSQQIGKCTYIGTPKWDTMADANVMKGIWYQKHDKDGFIVDAEFINTKDIVKPIYKIIVNEGDVEPKLYENTRTYLEFKGKTSWLNQMKKKYKGKANIKTIPTDRKIETLEMDNLKIEDFLTKYFEPNNNIPKQDILNYLRSLDG